MGNGKLMNGKRMQPKQRIIALIGLVPKPTSEVRKEIMALGISEDKLTKWGKELDANIKFSDLFLLRKYFAQYDSTGVQTVEDLYETTASRVTKKHLVK